MAIWKHRQLDKAPQPSAQPAIPDEIVHLAELLQVPVEHILRNPKSYTPRTHGTGDADSGHIDPCKLME
jgi:hypothetical protein